MTACACLVAGGLVGPAVSFLAPSLLFAQPPGASGNPMMQMANPASGSGRAGLRTFSRKTFDGGHVAWLAACTIGAGVMIPGALLLHGRWREDERFTKTALLLPPVLVLLTLLWANLGYSLSFASNWGTSSLTARELDHVDPLDIGRPFIGGLDHVGLAGLEPQSVDDALEFPLRRPDDQVPHLLFMAFQMAIAITAAVPLIVQLAPRISGGGLAIVSSAWMLVVYAPAAQWIWGYGWLHQRGALDFGGGSVRHMTIGLSALTAAFLLRKRDTPGGSDRGSSTVAFLAGGVLIWGGELFINGGGAWSASPTAAIALLNVQLAACAAACGWCGMDWLKGGAASGTSAISGALAGLATISAASGFVAPQSAMVIGLVAGVVCRGVSMLLASRSEGDLLSLFAIHGVGGFLGVVLVGVFASANFAGSNRFGRSIDGLLSGDSSLLVTQMMAGLAITGLSLAGTGIILLPFRFIGRASATDVDSDRQRTSGE